MAKKPGEQKREKLVSTRLTEDEYAQWEAATKAAGMVQVAQWNRETMQLILDAQSATPKGDAGLSREAVEAIRQRATNMNRVARIVEGLADAAGRLDEPALAKLEKAVAEAL